MSNASLAQIEQQINRLSINEQLLLMERLVQQIRRQTRNQPAITTYDLQAMANDLEIQREIQEIQV
ncbi:MAG: hypothetical protein ACE5EY_11545 [Anaerolineae bacterium]